MARSGRGPPWRQVLLSPNSTVANVVLGQTHGAAEYLTRNITVLPITVAAAAAAVFINRPRVQAACLVVELLMWVGYFGFQQNALTG